MTALKELQQAMQAAILQNDKQVCKHVNTDSRLSEQQRLSIYRNGYYVRLLNILRDNYQRLYELMGEEAFSAMMHAYLDAYPPTHYNIYLVGKRVAQFLAVQPGCQREFIELAQFEWAMCEALQADDMPALTLQDLANINPDNWGDLVLKLHPSLHLLPNYSENIPNVVWRCNNEVFYTTLSAEPLKLLTLISQRRNFTEICEAMLVDFDTDEALVWVRNTLENFIDQEFFTV